MSVPSAAAASPPESPREAVPAEAVVGPTWPQRVLFLVFVLTAFALFALATLLPILEQAARGRAEEQALRAQVKQSQARLAQIESLAAALRDDPGVNERLARTDLGYRKPGDTVVMVPPPAEVPGPVNVSSTVPGVPPARTLVPPTWPAWVQSAERWADARGLVRPFLDSQLHSAWLALSAGLVVAAFVLFSPRRRAAIGQEPP